MPQQPKLRHRVGLGDGIQERRGKTAATPSKSMIFVLKKGKSLQHSSLPTTAQVLTEGTNGRNGGNPCFVTQGNNLTSYATLKVDNR